MIYRNETLQTKEGAKEGPRIWKLHLPNKRRGRQYENDRRCKQKEGLTIKLLLRSVCCYHFPIHNHGRNLSSSSSRSQGGLTMMMILVVDDKRSKSYLDQIKKSDRAGTWRLAPPTWPLWASPAPPLSHQLYFHNLYCHHAGVTLKLKLINY